MQYFNLQTQALSVYLHKKKEMDIKLKYGQSLLAFKIPEHVSIPEFSEPEYGITKKDFISDVERYLPAEPEKYTDVAIVVSDKTRLCGYPEYLPWLTEILQKHGAKKDNICFYIAYGTHPKQSEEESRNSYGDIYKEFRFIHHDCYDVSAFETLGTTKRGTAITVRKDILKSSIIITFGAISHHYFAGYGGGRKLLFPGLAARTAIYQNHSLFLDKGSRTLATGCQPGNLEGNPLAEDLKEIDTYTPPKISIHGIMNASGKVCRLITGKTYEDFVEACNIHDGYYRYNYPEQYDLVVASSGGYPKDINFIQSHKSVHHAAAFVKDGGTLIVLAECIDKISSNYFMKYLEAGSFENAFALLEQNYEGNGGTALSMMTKTKRIRIYMLTSLDEGTCKTLNVIKISEDNVQEMIDKEKGSIAVIRNASILVK